MIYFVCRFTLLLIAISMSLAETMWFSLQLSLPMFLQVYKLWQTNFFPLAIGKKFLRLDMTLDLSDTHW